MFNKLIDGDILKMVWIPTMFLVSEIRLLKNPSDIGQSCPGGNVKLFHVDWVGAIFGIIIPVDHE